MLLHVAERILVRCAADPLLELADSYEEIVRANLPGGSARPG